MDMHVFCGMIHDDGHVAVAVDGLTHRAGEIDGHDVEPSVHLDFALVHWPQIAFGSGAVGAAFDVCLRASVQVGEAKPRLHGERCAGFTVMSAGRMRCC